MSGKLIACLYVLAFCLNCSDKRLRPSSACSSSRSAVLRQLCLEELRRESRERRDPTLLRLMSEQDCTDLAGEGVLSKLPLLRPLDMAGPGDETSKAGASRCGARERVERVERTERPERAGDGAAELLREEAREELREAAPADRALLKDPLQAWGGCTTSWLSRARPRETLLGLQDVCSTGGLGTVSLGFQDLAASRDFDRPLRDAAKPSLSESSSMSEQTLWLRQGVLERLRLNSLGTVTFVEYVGRAAEL